MEAGGYRIFDIPGKLWKRTIKRRQAANDFFHFDELDGGHCYGHHGVRNDGQEG